METKDKIYFGLLIICILAVAGIFLFMKSETAQCLKNPYIYGASHMEKVSCSCFQYTNPVCPAQFSFNDTTFTAETVRCGNPKYSPPTLDFSMFNITQR